MSSSRPYSLRMNVKRPSFAGEKPHALGEHFVLAKITNLGVINVDHPVVSGEDRTHAPGYSSEKRAQALVEKFKSLAPLPRIHAMRVAGMINVGPVEVDDPRSGPKLTKSRIATLHLAKMILLQSVKRSCRINTLPD